jgi:hypothetical protein
MIRNVAIGGRVAGTKKSIFVTRGLLVAPGKRGLHSDVFSHRIFQSHFSERIKRLTRPRYSPVRLLNSIVSMLFDEFPDLRGRVPLCIWGGGKSGK